ncbi:MAG: FKBP-type peptidyl-prolyl cis-trans isomerase [Treponema sp.]|jgi:FKBP-type peptidyl-prolyl cis-trans isomerase|nr:FKBP-type peptidyl-prolyl cis-trans isomerase [Treponema sp.]
MKKLSVLILLSLLVTALHARAIQEDYRRAEEKARVSYAAGMLIGSNYSPLPFEIDYDAFKEGFKAALENTGTQFSMQEALEIVNSAYYVAMERMAEENRRLEEEFLINNSRRPGVHVTSSGLQYEILVDKPGEKPDNTSIVRVNYEGSFTDGTLFDTSEEGGTYIPLDMVIPGWSEGVMLMGTGSTYRLYIPSSLAYGREGAQSAIPPYTTLIFLVELLEIIDPDYLNFNSPDSINYYDDFEPEGPAENY